MPTKIIPADAKPKIIAVDFDGCLCENAFPDIGAMIPETIARALEEQRLHGSRIILWTCRTGAPLDAAVKWCAQRGLTFDAVNENLPEILAAFEKDSRKIFAHEYWDDRAVRMPR